MVLVGMLCVSAWAEARFPPPEFRTPYTMPTEQFPLQRAMWWAYVDVAVFAGVLGLATYFVHKKRARTGVFALTAFAVAYFGFWREGCVCAVGSIQNVAAATSGVQALPWVVGVFFALPLLFALFAGRVFCAGVCPLGAIQDVVLFKPVQVPTWVEAGFGMFAHLYLGLAVMLAATGTDFIICSYDPFVSFFRFSGTVGMLLLGAGLLLTSMFVGRAYCRFICPYSVLLRFVSRLSQWKVHVSPTICTECRLCEKSCPFGAIRTPTGDTLPERETARKRLRSAIAVMVLLAVVLPVGGYMSRGLLGKMDRRVKLADRVHLEEKAKVKVQDRSDETKAWWKSGETVEDLEATAAGVVGKLGIGGAIVGLWMAVVAGVRLVRWSVPARRKGYDADAAGCLACARCFTKCPIELERRGMVELTVSAGGRA